MPWHGHFGRRKTVPLSIVIRQLMKDGNEFFVNSLLKPVV
jgi:hypothetical protein